MVEEPVRSYGKTTVTTVNPFPAWVRGVGIFTPSGIPDEKRLNLGIERIRSWGIQIHFSPVHHHPLRFLAGRDMDRTDQINRLLNNTEVDILIAVRGGYGATRILDKIDWQLLAERRLPLVGYSDITALHLAAFRAGCRHGIAGPMVAGAFARCGMEGDERISALRALDSFGALLRNLSANGQPISHSLGGLKCGCHRGSVIPANLAVLAALLGTPHLPSLDGVILVLEDVNEPAFRIDRYLQQLLRAGILEQIGGLVFGQFTACEDAAFLLEILAEYAGYIPGPVGCHLGFGHEPGSISLPVGRDAILSINNDTGTLTIPPDMR